MLMAKRNRIRLSAGTSADRVPASPVGSSIAQRTASTTLLNSTSRPSPIVRTMRPLMFGDLRIDEITAHRSQSRQGALLVDAHQAGIADDIGAQDDGKPMLYSGICHASRCPLGFQRIIGSVVPRDTRVKPLRAEFPCLMRRALLPLGGGAQTIMFSPSKVVISNPSKFSPA